MLRLVLALVLALAAGGLSASALPDVHWFRRMLLLAAMVSMAAATVLVREAATL